MAVTVSPLAQAVAARVAGAEAPVFTPGQLLEALVLGKLPDGLTMLRIGDFAVSARLPQTLPPGATLQLQVTVGGGTPQLAIVGQPAAAPIPAQPMPIPPPLSPLVEMPVAQQQVAAGAPPAAVATPTVPARAPATAPAAVAAERIATASPPAPANVESRQTVVTTSAAIASTPSPPTPTPSTPILPAAAPVPASAPPPAPVAGQGAPPPAAAVTVSTPPAPTTSAAPPPAPPVAPVATPAPIAPPSAPAPIPQLAPTTPVATAQPAAVPSPIAPGTPAAPVAAPVQATPPQASAAPAPAPAVTPATPPSVATAAPAVATAAMATPPPAMPAAFPPATPAAPAQVPPTALPVPADTTTASPLLVAQGAARPAASMADLPRLAPALPPAVAPAATPTQPATPQAALTQMVPEALAKQNSLGPLLLSLATAVTKSGVMPEPVLRAALQVLAQRVTVPPNGPTPELLKAAIAKSGVYLEAGLARGTPPAGDMKAAVGQLKASLGAWLGGNPAPVQAAQQAAPPLRAMPPRAEPIEPPPLPPLPHEAGRALHSQADAALSRLKLLQFASLPDADPVRGQVPEQRMELPFLIGSELVMAQFQVFRDGARAKPGERKRGWTMRFAMNFAAAGEIGAEIGLLGRSVNVALWAAEPETAEKLNAALPELAPALARLGLDAGSVRVRNLPPEAEKPASGQFVDSVS